MPLGVSSMHQMPISAGAPAASSAAAACVTVAGSSTLGSIAASAPLPATAARSSSNHFVPTPLIRTTISRAP